MPATITHKQCGHPIPLPEGERLAVGLMVSAALWCPVCYVKVAPLAQAVQYVERRG